MTAPLSTHRSLALGPRMSLASFAVALLMLPAWPSSASAASLEDIKKRGYMIVATEDDYPPFEFVVDGKPMGYDHELLTILRKSAGFEVRQEILPWQGILPGVASGKYDVARLHDAHRRVDDGLREAQGRRIDQEPQGPVGQDARAAAGRRVLPGVAR